MIEGPTQPMEIAAKVLSVETQYLVSRTMDIQGRGFNILDRWALNEPENLKALEASGEMRFLNRVLKQQRLENEVLRSPRGEELLRNGLAAHEILDMYGVSMEI